MHHKFSLIMSIYNKIKVDELVWSIKGLKNQSIQPDEIIIVLDGYCRINLVYNLKKYLNLYFKNKFKILLNKKNRGIPYSYNKAIRYSKHNFVAINDADDYSHFDRFKKQIKFLNRYQNIGIIGSYVKEVDSKKTSIKKVPIENKLIKYLSLIKNPMNHPTIMFNKSIFFKKLKYENCERMEDYYLWIRAMDNKIIFSNLPFPLVTTKLNSSFFKRRSGSKLVKSELKILKYYIKTKKFMLLPLLIIFFIKSAYHLVPGKFKPEIRKYINSF